MLYQTTFLSQALEGEIKKIIVWIDSWNKKLFQTLKSGLKLPPKVFELNNLSEHRAAETIFC